VQPAGPPVPVRNLETETVGPSRQEQLQRLLRMPAKDQVEFIYGNIEAVLEMTEAHQASLSGPPIQYDVRDGNKIVCSLVRDDCRIVTATVQQALQDITHCKHHSKDRCECWRGYRDQLGYYRDSRAVDHPISLALEYYWDLVEATAKDRPKKDQTTEALQQLTNQVQAIAEQQSSVIDNQGQAWVGRKKASRVLGVK